MARKSKVVMAPAIQPAMVHFAKATKFLEIPKGIDPSRHEDYKSGFCCPSCGSLHINSHNYTCDAAKNAKEAGVSLIEYAKTPSLWCPVISGHGDERVRCVLPGQPQHEGQHGFPTRHTCHQAQKALGALEDVPPQVKHHPQEDAMAKAEAATKTNGKKTGKKGNTAALKKAQEANEGKRAELHAQKIHLLTKDNPKREGTAAYKRFEMYKNGMTVGEALAKGITMSDIRYNEEHGHIKLS